MKIKKSVVMLGSGLLGLAFFALAKAQDAAPAAASSAPAAATPDKAAPTLKAEAKLGTAIDKLEPTGVAESFDESVGKVVGWSKVEGANEPADITHVWIYKGNEIATVPLTVKSSPYRTYSRKTVTGFVGPWTFQVKDASGNVLAEKKFEVTASAPAATTAPAAAPASNVPVSTAPASAPAPANKPQ